MPCTYYEPTPTPHEQRQHKRGREAVKVAKLLVWLHEEHHVTHDRVDYGAAINAARGANRPSLLDHFTEALCSLCSDLDESIIYNGKDRVARQLAEWWEDHQERDAKRLAAEKKKNLKGWTEFDGSIPVKACWIINSHDELRMLWGYREGVKMDIVYWIEIKMPELPNVK